MFFSWRHSPEGRKSSPRPLAEHQGVFRRQLTKFEGVALIVSATIGAGVLAIPYSIAKVGSLVGLVYIVGLGLLMMGFNLLIGDIAVRTKGNMQLVGLAKRYLGKTGGALMTIIAYFTLSGALSIFIIGIGQSLAALFGGSAFQWSLIFFFVGIFLIYIGVRTIKVIDFFLSLGIMAVIVLIAFFSAPHIELANYSYNNFTDLLLPYGVILFAYRGSSSVLEAHSILTDRNKTFKSVIIIAGLVNIVAYTLFSFAVLGVTGTETTEIATIGLGNRVGQTMFLFGNIFAFLAMSTNFLTTGLAFRDSLHWDHKLPPKWAAALAGAIPLTIFLLGLRQFAAAIGIVGGVLISLEMLVVLVIYWRAKQAGDLKPKKYNLHHSLALVTLLLIALTIGTIYSVGRLF